MLTSHTIAQIFSLNPIKPKFQLFPEESAGFWAYRGQEKEFWDMHRQVTPLFNEKPVFCGVEVEIENVKLKDIHKPDAVLGWNTHQDNSLRAGVEYVSYPLAQGDMEVALASLFHWLKYAVRTTPEFSWRTSIHVHVNARDMTLNEISNLILLYSIFEGMLFEFSSNRSRAEGVFCVPLTQCALQSNIREFFASQDISQITHDYGWDKYSALNANRLKDYGTLEFRHMPGTWNIVKISQWIDVIIRLRLAASRLSREEILGYLKQLNTLSNYGELQHKVFGDAAPLIGAPQNSIKLLSAGVSYAKECLIADKALRVAEKGSHMHTFIDSLLKKQEEQLAKYAKDRATLKSTGLDYNSLLNSFQAQTIVQANAMAAG